jgi:hypothetical protein
MLARLSMISLDRDQPIITSLETDAIEKRTHPVLAR